MEGSEINKLIDNLYKECIIHEQMPVEYQLGMEIFLRRLKQSISALKSLPVNEVKDIVISGGLQAMDDVGGKGLIHHEVKEDSEAIDLENLSQDNLITEEQLFEYFGNKDRSRIDKEISDGILIPTHVVIPIKDLEDQITVLTDYINSHTAPQSVHWLIKRATLEYLLNNNKQIFISPQ